MRGDREEIAAGLSCDDHAYVTPGQNQDKADVVVIAMDGVDVVVERSVVVVEMGGDVVDDGNRLVGRS